MPSRSRYRREPRTPPRWLDVLRRFHAENMMQTSAALAFATLLAIVPLVTVVVSVGEFVPYLGGLLARLDDWGRSTLLPSGAAGVIASNIGKFSHKAQGLTWAGLGMLTLTAFLLLNTIERAFNHVWLVAPRPLWARVRLYVFVMAVWPFILAAMAAAVTFAVSGAMEWLNESVEVHRLAIKTVSLMLLGTFFAFLYYAVPNAPVSRRAALIGGLFATAGFALLQRLFELYLIKSAVLKGVYGAFSVFPVFLVWLHLCWAVVLFGGLIAARAFRQA